MEYRKEWDSHVIKIEKVDEDKETGSEIVYWATHFPVCCSNRIYTVRKQQAV